MNFIIEAYFIKQQQDPAQVIKLRNVFSVTYYIIHVVTYNIEKKHCLN
jgi:hypothetical protein